MKEPIRWKNDPDASPAARRLLSLALPTAAMPPAAHAAIAEQLAQTTAGASSAASGSAASSAGASGTGATSAGVSGSGAASAGASGTAAASAAASGTVAATASTATGMSVGTKVVLVVSAATAGLFAAGIAAYIVRPPGPPRAPMLAPASEQTSAVPAETVDDPPSEAAPKASAPGTTEASLGSAKAKASPTGTTDARSESAAVESAAVGAPVPTPTPQEAVRPSKKRRRREVSGTAAKPKFPAQDLVAEAALLERARRAAVSAPRDALHVLQTHTRRYPNGALAAEREVLAIEVLAPTRTQDGAAPSGHAIPRAVSPLSVRRPSAPGDVGLRYEHRVRWAPTMLCVVWAASCAEPVELARRRASADVGPSMVPDAEVIDDSGVRPIVERGCLRDQGGADNRGCDPGEVCHLPSGTCRPGIACQADADCDGCLSLVDAPTRLDCGHGFQLTAWCDDAHGSVCVRSRAPCEPCEADRDCGRGHPQFEGGVRVEVLGL